MLERYSIGATAQQIQDFFGVDPNGFEKPRFNAAPAQLLPVITVGSPGISHFYWGTAPERAKNKPISEKIINIKLETIQEKPVVRKAMKKNRCIVPADGFYCWKKIGKKSTVPYRIEMKNKSLFAMAGIWEEYDDENGEMFHTFSIITRPSNQWVSSIGERMPLILDAIGQQFWISETAEEPELMSCLVTSTGPELIAYTISNRINSSLVDDPTLIQPAPGADQFGNLTLFS